MTSPFLITTGSNLTSPPASAPKYEKDYAIVTGVGTPSMIIDKVAASSAAVTTQSFASGVVQPSSTTYKLMTAAGCTPLTDANAPADGITVASLDCRVGRPSYHDLTSRSDLAFTDILSRDWDNAQGYLS